MNTSLGRMLENQDLQGIDMDEQTLENEIAAKGLTAPRITPEHIDAQIANRHFDVLPGTSLMRCVLTLKNGFQVTGESASASLENFDADIGKRLAFERARNKIWPLESYRLRSKLAGIE
jgi:hypothetical protein